MATSGTYVYCVIGAERRPRIRRRFPRPAGMGPVRLLPVDRHLWLVVADAPLDQYGERRINKKLSDLEWVSRAAVAHEAVVEAFLRYQALLPMKLFTIFNSDARAVEQVLRNRRRVDALLRRVAGHLEWGVRITLKAPTSSERMRTAGNRSGATTRAGARGAGARYLSLKKVQREAETERARQGSRTMTDVYDRLSAQSALAKRRSSSELPLPSGPLLLDAAFLVPRSRMRLFRSSVKREGTRLGRLGYQLALTGPWPPYTFVKD
jgi:Gas vesicle synthesis protein GvpL/GvpF